MREILDIFLYGAGLIHARGKKQADRDRLKEILKTYPREKLVMSFHSSMKYLFDDAVTVYPVLKQDFLHWTNDLGMTGPDLVDIAKLLGSTPFVPKAQTGSSQ